MIKKKQAHGEDGVIKFTQLMKADNLTDVLDIGCGIQQTHVTYMRKRGLEAKGIDVLPGPYFDGNYNTYNFNLRFEGIHAAHVLEHQLNTHNFLCKVFDDLIEGGYLCITVPPLKHRIVGGHVSLWNAGLILYHLVLAGFNCQEAKIKEYGYNISVIVKKKSIREGATQLVYDSPDMVHIHKYIPPFKFTGATPKTPGAFNGDIKEYNW